MAIDVSDQRDVLFLRDGAGGIYLIPREVVETYRVPEEQRSALAESPSGDVAGFGATPIGAPLESPFVSGEFRNLREILENRLIDPAVFKGLLTPIGLGGGSPTGPR